MTRCGVVGAGAVGLATARALARRGIRVEVFERDEVGAGSSGLAAGIVYDAFADALELELATRSLESFTELTDRGLSFSRTPYLWFATESGNVADAIREDTSRLRDHGRPVRLVDQDWVHSRYPQLHAGDIDTAAVTEGSGLVDPDSLLEVLAADLREAGGEIHEQTPARLRTDPVGLRTPDHTVEVDAVVVTAGAETAALCGEIGLRIPVGAYPSQAALISGPATPTFYDATAGVYSRPHRGGFVAGVEPSPGPADTSEAAVDPEETDRLTRYFVDRLVNFDGTVTEAWAGVCTATPDRYPILGEAIDDVFVGTGWHGHGLMLSPGAGSVLADAVCGEPAPAAFDPRRFRGDEPVHRPAGVLDGRDRD